MKKPLTALLCAVLMLALIPQIAKAVEEYYTYVHEDGGTETGLPATPSFAQVATLSGLPEMLEAAEDYTYVDENGDMQTTAGHTVTPITAETATLTGGWYVVDSDVTRTSTITVSGDVTLILMDGFTLSVTGDANNAGIRVSPGNSLTVYGQAGGTGTLQVQGGEYGAGIGGGKDTSGGRVTIHSGTVTAMGGTVAAGIGGGYWSLSGPNVHGGEVTIYGGTVTAVGGNAGAGIGGGCYGAGGTVKISGGTVIATGGTDGGAGIGGGKGIMGGNYSIGGTINISGGSVTATGKDYGAGIGGGYQGTGGTITISDGTIVAKSGNSDYKCGAGIGGGCGKDGGRITISGGTINATSLNEGAGIGGGPSGASGIITISGGTVTATSIYRGAGIGGGDMGTGSTINIQGGTIIAKSNYGGAGIGGGCMNNGGNINISGGDVTATGGSWGAGIGGGAATLYNGEPRGSGGNITISGGVVRAYAGDYNTGIYSGSAGIGAGGTNSANTHNGGTIKITGGKVTAGGSYSSLDIGRGRNGVNGTLLIDDAAKVNLVANGIDSSVSTTTLGTCILQGSAAGSLLGAYLDGTKVDGPLIDLSSPTLASGIGYTVSGNSVTLTGIANAFYILSDSTIARNVIVSPGVSADVVLFAAEIAPTSGCAFDMTGATVNMTLIGANALNSADGHAGLQVPAGAALQVVGSGSLTAQGGMNGAGIGGQSGVSAGSIAVYSGNVEALGSGGGAGIGGGNGGAGGIVLAEGADTIVSATGGPNGYDIGSGNGNVTGGSLTVNNNATVLLNRNGTNAAVGYITCTVGGEGAGLKAGPYVNSYKLLTYCDVDISPALGAQALDTVTLRVEVEGLSDVAPEGYISFLSNGTEIGQAKIIRTGVESSDGAAEFLWTAFGGTHAITAKYAQNASGDSYITTQSAQIASAYTISRIAQTPLAIAAPGTRTYGDAPFDLSVSGGSGAGGLSFTLKSGDAVSVTATGQLTVIKAGTATIAVKKAADTNYEEANAEIEITVNKATPPALVFPTSSGITYGATLSASVHSGGSGDGGFAWENPDTVPTVDNSGYNVIFTPRDTDNYDYSGFTLEDIVAISVSKALPAVTFPTASSITYGESLSSSTLSGGSGDGSFVWKNPDTVPHVINSGYAVVFKPGDAENYQTVEQIVSISVNKADQAPLSVHVPGAIRYGYADFTLDVSGGSGTGALSYAVISGDSVAVDASGRVRVLNLGISVLTVTKAGDDLYNETSVSVEIRVKANATSGAAATRSPTSHPTASPSAGALPAPSNNVVFTPSVSASPALVIDVLPATPASPSPSGALPAPLTDAIPAPYEETAVLMPINMEENSETGRIMVEVSITDLPEDTTAIRLASGKVIYIDHTQETLQLEVGRDDLNTQGELEILALHEQIPLALYKIAVVCAHGQVSAADSKIHVLIWIAGGIVLAGLAGAIIVIRQKKYKQRV